jgi:hypothetical protein
MQTLANVGMPTDNTGECKKSNRWWWLNKPKYVLRNDKRMVCPYFLLWWWSNKEISPMHNMTPKNIIFLDTAVPYWAFKHSLNQAVCLQIHIFFICKQNNNLPYLGLFSSYYIFLGIIPEYILHLFFHSFHNSLMNHIPWLICFEAWNSLIYSGTKFNLFFRNETSSHLVGGGGQWVWINCGLLIPLKVSFLSLSLSLSLTLST